MRCSHASLTLWALLFTVYHSDASREFQVGGRDGGRGAKRAINIPKKQTNKRDERLPIYTRDLAGQHGSSSEVTFLSLLELAAELFPGVRVRWKWSSQWAGRRRFFTSETVLLVSPNRDSR